MSDRYTLDPLLISVGSKRWARDQIWKLYYKASKERNTSLRFVDPFAGGLSLPLYIMPDRALLNDLNSYVINFYRYIAKNGSMPSLDHLDENGDGKSKDIYLAKRERFNQKIADDDPLDDEFAILWYYLNRAAYGGLSRFNKKGFFNAPYRGHISNAKTDFSLEQDVFGEWEFTSVDWRDVLKKVQDDDFLFVDPPYDEVFNKYIQREFTWEDQVDLAQSLAKLSNPIVATNSTSDRIIELYTDLGFDVCYRFRSNSLQKPKVRNGVHKDFKEAVFTKNLIIEVESEDE